MLSVAGKLSRYQIGPCRNLSGLALAPLVRRSLPTLINVFSEVSEVHQARRLLRASPERRHRQSIACSFLIGLLGAHAKIPIADFFQLDCDGAEFCHQNKECIGTDIIHGMLLI